VFPLPPINRWDHQFLGNRYVFDLDRQYTISISFRKYLARSDGAFIMEGWFPLSNQENNQSNQGIEPTQFRISNWNWTIDGCWQHSQFLRISELSFSVQWDRTVDPDLELVAQMQYLESSLEECLKSSLCLQHWAIIVNYHEFYKSCSAQKSPWAHVLTIVRIFQLSILLLS
jgi:hypothetical protein